jgi:sugar/nucleoside kinase (ribokinase family)
LQVSFCANLRSSAGVQSGLGFSARTGRAAFHFELPIRPNGDRPALHVIGANAAFTIEDVPWKLIESARHLHLGGSDSMRGLGRGGAAEILRRAHERGASTTLDILSEGSPKLLAILEPSLPFADWFLPNADQAMRLTGASCAEDAARTLLDRGARGIVLTMGAEGSLLMTRQMRMRLAAHEIRAIDTSGCGDAYCAGFIRGMLLGWPAPDCAKLGNAAAALVAQALGSDAGIGDLDDTLRFMRETPLRS